MLGGSSCCGSAKGGAKNTKKKVVKPKKGVVKKIKGGNTGTEPVPETVTEPEHDPVTEPGNVTGTGTVSGGAKKTKKRVVKPKKIVKKYGKRKGGYADPPVNNDESDGEQNDDDRGDKQDDKQGDKQYDEQDDKQNGDQGGGAKKKKGSKVVKRALSPYNKFVKKNFAIMKKKFPNEKAPQIMQKVAIEWKIFKNK